LVPRRARALQQRDVHLGLVRREAQLLKSRHDVHAVAPLFGNYLCSYYYGGKEVLRQAPSLRLRGWAAARRRGSAVARHAAPRLRGTRLRGCAAARLHGYAATRTLSAPKLSAP